MESSSPGDNGQVSGGALTSPQAQPGPNPLAQAMKFSVSMPEMINVRMVDASGLTDYEVQAAIASVMANFAVGFWVTYATSRSHMLLTVSIILSLFSGLFFLLAFAKRSKLRSGMTTVTFGPQGYGTTGTTAHTTEPKPHVPSAPVSAPGSTPGEVPGPQ